MKFVLTFALIVGFCTLAAFHSESAQPGQAVPDTNSFSSQPLTPEQVKAALDHKQEPKPGPGTWRYVSIAIHPWGTTFETNYLYVTTNEQRFERIEQTDRSTNKTSSVRTYLRIKNSEGSWSLHQKIAILTPKEKSDSKDDESDPTEKEFEALAIYSGERFTQGGRVLLRAVGELNAEARRKSVDLLLKRLKKEKEIPFFVRMLMSTMKGKIADVLPGRFESVIEEQTGALILDRLYDKNGSLTSETYYWEPCPDFPPEKFTIPENLQRIRPKTAKDARELERKTRDQDAKSSK
jgi:hypothetical protein